MIKKMVIYALFGLAVCVWSRAEEPKKTPETPAAATAVKDAVPDISADEQLQLRNIQVDIMQTYQLLLDLQDHQKKLWGALYEKYHLNPDQFAACDGPGVKPCDTVPHGKIAFKKKEAEKK
jgi:hypothetical protein